MYVYIYSVVMNMIHDRTVKVRKTSFLFAKDEL